MGMKNLPANVLKDYPTEMFDVSHRSSPTPTSLTIKHIISLIVVNYFN